MPLLCDIVHRCSCASLHNSQALSLNSLPQLLSSSHSHACPNYSLAMPGSAFPTHFLAEPFRRNSVLNTSITFPRFAQLFPSNSYLLLTLPLQFVALLFFAFVCPGSAFPGNATAFLCSAFPMPICAILIYATAFLLIALRSSSPAWLFFASARYL